jgi:hypothetical protein
MQRMGQKAGLGGVVRLRQPKPTTVTFMADERKAPTEDLGERPPRMRPIWSLPDEETEEESEGEPLQRNNKRKGVNEQGGQQEPFLLAIGGQTGPDGDEGGTGWVELPDYFKTMAARRKRSRARAHRPCPGKICLSQTFPSLNRS